MIGINNKNLMTQQRIAVSTDGGELVVLTIGNAEIKMGYETALQLSQWLRVRAKQAKKRAGDEARHWSVIGTLTDANKTRG